MTELDKILAEPRRLLEIESREYAIDQAIPKIQALINQARIDTLDDFVDKRVGKALAHANMPNGWIYKARDKYVAELKGATNE